MQVRRAVLGALAFAAVMGAGSTSALAWGCRAEGPRGAYGYSYNFAQRSAAMARAINECHARRAGRCRLVMCRRD